MCNRLIVVPTAHLAQLVYRAVRRQRIGYNYVAGWRDISGGIGLSLGNVDWLKPGETYINPHTH